MKLQGLVYRAHNPAWVFLPSSGHGAALHGGRFNPRGVEALYTSLRLETAWLGAQQSFPFKAQPMKMCAYKVDCEHVVDLTDDIELTRLGITADDLSCPWEDLANRRIAPPSWKVAETLISDGVAGVIAPSFAAGARLTDVNAVFWRWSDTPPHKVMVVDDLRRLPKNDASWS